MEISRRLGMEKTLQAIDLLYKTGFNNLLDETRQEMSQTQEKDTGIYQQGLNITPCIIAFCH